MITSTYVTKDKLPILYVSHECDEDGDLWQFHCGNGDYSMNKMQLVKFSTLLSLDSSIIEVEEMKIGYSARRKNLDDPWHFEREH